MSRPARPERPRAPFWRLDPGGSALGLVLAVLSVTPSLLPRPALLQGVIAATAFSIGYLVGAAVWDGARRLVPRPSPTVRRLLWAAYALLWIAALTTLTSLAVAWQNEVRRMVEMPPLTGADLGGFLAGFVVVTAALLSCGKSVRVLFQSLRPRLGAPAAVLGSGAIVVAGVAALVVALVIAIDAIYLDRNARADAGTVEPASAHRSAGPDSAIAWDDLGRHGAAFVGGGPTPAEIEAVTGVAAVEPIRVYAGLASADTIDERAALVVDELERTGAFERSVLVVATTTGSGWLEPQTVDAIEYLHAGDTAIAAMQYAYTPSWVSFVFDPDAPVEAARALWRAVEDRWLSLPADERPMLVSYGLSLGAHGSQSVFADLAEVRERADAALFVGSPNGSELWRTLTDARDAGSPVWQPVVDAGRDVRWISRQDDVLPGPWEHPRVLYLQHATDPVTWLDAALVWRSPEWLEPSQRADDVSPSMRWMPFITAAQVTVDMLGGEAVPARHGHNFGDVVTFGWREVTGDAGLDDDTVARIEAVIAEYAPIPAYTVFE